MAAHDTSGRRKGICWAAVSEYMNGTRSAMQCCTKWGSMQRQTEGVVLGPWSQEEDELLLQGVKKCRQEGSKISWVKVCEYMGGTRTGKQCFQRWEQTVKYREFGTAKSTGTWSAEEDESLRVAVGVVLDVHGTILWSQVSKAMNDSRTSEQCRGRWEIIKYL